MTKDSENIDYILSIAAPVDDEVPSVWRNAKGSARPVTAEAQVIRSAAFLKIASVVGTGTVHVGLDIAKRLP